jgi:hypothetical protein
MIPDIEIFLPVVILKMSVTIPHKFNIVRFQRHFMWVDYDVPKWFLTSKNICGIVAAILKMVTGRNFSMSAINSGHHYLPTYQILIISDNVEFLQYCGGHFENGDR